MPAKKKHAQQETEASVREAGRRGDQKTKELVAKAEEEPIESSSSARGRKAGKGKK